MLKFEDIERGDLCLGCGLCVGGSDAVDLVLSSRGFYYPRWRLDRRAAADEVLRICPGVNVLSAEKWSDAAKLWGRVQSCFIGWASDEAVRYRGASGGGISAVAIALLDNGIVDCVLQVAPSSSDPFKNDAVVSCSRDDVLRGAGSRYGPGSPLSKLRSVIESGQRCALVGKPCDIVGAKLLVRELRENGVNLIEPYYISFFCGGMPSLLGTEKLIESMGLLKDSVMDFRYRGDGWPGAARAQCQDGAVHRMDYADSWGRVLNKYLHFRCKLCPDSIGDEADIVFGDAWYSSEAGGPIFCEAPGRSFVLVRNAAGGGLIECAVKSGALITEKTPIEYLATVQPHQAERRSVGFFRVAAFVMGSGIVPRFPYLDILARSAGNVKYLKRVGRNFWGMLIRTLKRCKQFESVR